MKIDIPEIIDIQLSQTFNFKDAIDTQLVAVREDNTINVTNLRTEGNFLEAEINGATYKFNYNGTSVDKNINWTLVNVYVDTSKSKTTGTEGTRGDATDKETIAISSMQPRETFANSAMQAIIGTMHDPITQLNELIILKVASISFKLAQAMITQAAAIRAATVEPPTPTDKPDKIDIDINEISEASDKILYNLYVELASRNIDERQRFDALNSPEYEVDSKGNETISKVKGTKLDDRFLDTIAGITRTPTGEVDKVSGIKIDDTDNRKRFTAITGGKYTGDDIIDSTVKGVKLFTDDDNPLFVATSTNANKGFYLSNNDNKPVVVTNKTNTPIVTKLHPDSEIKSIGTINKLNEVSRVKEVLKAEVNISSVPSKPISIVNSFILDTSKFEVGNLSIRTNPDTQKDYIYYSTETSYIRTKEEVTMHLPACIIDMRNIEIRIISSSNSVLTQLYNYPTTGKVSIPEGDYYIAFNTNDTVTDVNSIISNNIAIIKQGLI